MQADVLLKITVVTTTLLLPTVAFGSEPPDDIQKKKISQQAHRMQIPFIQNTGQIDNTDVSFYAHTFGGTLFVETSGIITYRLPKSHTNVVIKEIFPERQRSTVTGIDPSLTTVNYFHGNDRSKWRSHVPTYGTVSVGEIHDGINLTLKAYGNNVEKLFTISPGARPEAIRVHVDGAKGLKVNAKGELHVDTAGGPVTFTGPVAYQDFEYGQRYVEVVYIVDGATYGFDVGKYDRTRPLIIDPLLASTFIGGSGTDTETTIALDGEHVYVTGRTGSSSFPTTSGSYDEGYNGDSAEWGDVFVLRCDKGLSSLEASTFIGGSDGDRARSIAVDGSYVYVTGQTHSSDFPTTSGSYDQSYNLHGDAFILRLSNDLSVLDASTYLGGWNGERSSSVVSDRSQVYVTGWTASHDFPTTSGAYNEVDHGGTNQYDVFVSRFNADLSTLEASTFMGGSSHDVGGSLAVDGSHVYLVGGTASPDFSTTSGSYDESYNGGEYDAFVSRFDRDLTTLEASTLIGGSATESGGSIAMGGSHIYVTGHTASSEFPTTSGAYDLSYNGGEHDGFISRLDGDLTTLEASTFIGGSDYDYTHSIALDGIYVYVAGQTHSLDFPATSGAYDESYNGGDTMSSSQDWTLAWPLLMLARSLAAAVMSPSVPLHLMGVMFMLLAALHLRISPRH